MTTKRTAAEARQMVLSEINAEYLALIHGYITAEKARINVLDILMDAPRGRKAKWNDQLHATIMEMEKFTKEGFFDTDARTEWFILQYGCIFLGYAQD